MLMLRNVFFPEQSEEIQEALAILDPNSYFKK